MLIQTVNYFSSRRCPELIIINPNKFQSSFYFRRSLDRPKMFNQWEILKNYFLFI